ncbi:MAG TPA: 23S rRNA (pseudouridine(1915)-N(3))-methyltransferase RlmH [Rhodocyclaceae bacterium]|nr:23S rRNA (pseudouridine(1915)-N(3))-methyltransferase RlmH [Rhodocyclaceae bacterium]HNH34749.1 23S rRNA (pseudouridine(1915)-N(3))-methyltransferase RlmH [Rhodocyclaceae bacterium]
MKLVVLAVGTRMPAWVEEGWKDFSRRMPRELPMELMEVKAEPRTSGKPVPALLAAEEGRLRQATPSGFRRIVLDERGRDLTTRALAERLGAWMGEGRDAAFLIGGPDGLAPALKEEADETWRLSSLTLPHALARVLLAEALYRAASLLKGHPYHRE